MTKFTGKWKYQSFLSDPINIDSDSPQFETWSTPGDVTVDECGTTGKLVLTGLPKPIDLTIKVTEGKPDQLYISAVVQLSETVKFTNELQGWFVPKDPKSDDSPLVIRGSIVQTSADIAPTPQPVYTTGFFVLEKA